MKYAKLFSIFLSVLLFLLPSCLGNDTDNDYTEWYNLNMQYLQDAENETADGSLVYDKIIPEWDKSIYVLMRWHNDRSENINKLTPLSNSTVTANYTLSNIEGDTLDQGASFQFQPNGMIAGFSTAVTNMQINDTVTVVIPYYAAYGVAGSGSILPFSTLIFGIKLLSIDKLY